MSDSTTAKACLKLWFGFPVSRAAVASGGSGPAMRSAIIGAYFAEDEKRRREFVSASSRLTHRGWQAEAAALAVTECVALTVRSPRPIENKETINLLRSLATETDWQFVISQIEAHLAEQRSVEEFARALGLTRGVSGYSLHVVPVAIYAWLRHPDDFRRAMISALECGGDTDTVGAILGALMGANLGKSGIPLDWRDHLWEWPRSVGFVKQVATNLAARQRGLSFGRSSAILLAGSNSAESVFPSGRVAARFSPARPTVLTPFATHRARKKLVTDISDATQTIGCRAQIFAAEHFFSVG
ncbi:MAG: ADP-ribosylglycohydrolase family protein [Verrucomicrobiota bacterium]